MWEKMFIDTDRGKFELFVSGNGEPLCVTHLYSAFDQRGNTFANPFTSFYRVYLINLRGCGNSVEAKTEEQFSMYNSVKDLEAIRIALGYEKWGFAGHSTGGMLALKYSIMAPSSLTKIVAGGASASKEYSSDVDCIYCNKNQNYPRVMQIIKQLNDLTTTIDTRKQLSYEWSKMSFYSEDKLKQALELPNSGKTVGARLEYFINTENPKFDLRESLVNVSIPSYIYAGKYDAQCPYKYGVEIAKLIPGAKFTTFERSNHNPFVEEIGKFKEFVKSTL
ncbi:alpha/beta fold hydrolase [Alkalihalobacterium sp. APHAB7]|uniref:alpha/beta fold hydrolase n=1 Tax=Alkalihalobacterium sp. APHAB7 TaxID=3402081 RepID=UPI003AAD8E86